MRKALVVILALLVTGCAPGSSGARTSPSATATPTPTASPSPALSASPSALADPGPFTYTTTTVATGLAVPWALDFAPDGSMWVTERGGTVRVVRGGGLVPSPALTLSVYAQPGCEGGLLGIALRPPDAYLYYTRSTPSGPMNRISRFTITGDTLTGEQVVLDNIPAGTCYHDGGRLKFGPDGFLYFTNGEGFVAAQAAVKDNLSGKVMRMHPDGTGLEMVAWGFRNPQGLAWDAAGRLYVSNNGPTGEFGLCCHDEVDVVQGSQPFYGWPAWAAGTRTSYSGAALPSRSGPIAESGTSVWAPSGLAFFAARKTERATLFMGELKGEAVRRFIIDPADPGHVLSQEVVFGGQGRLRDVVAGPDGCLYVTTSNRDGRGSPRSGDDRIFKLCPQ